MIWVKYLNKMLVVVGGCGVVVIVVIVVVIFIVAIVTVRFHCCVHFCHFNEIDV